MRQRNEPDFAEKVRKLQQPRWRDGPRRVNEMDAFEESDPSDPNISVMSQAEAVRRIAAAEYEEQLDERYEEPPFDMEPWPDGE